MRDKVFLRKIRDIIFAENPNVVARKSNNGYLMYFQNYSNITYHKIDILLNNIGRDILEKHSDTITETSDLILLSSDADDLNSNTDYTNSRSRLRYSNREKRLIRRKQYDNVVDINSVNNQKNNLFTKASPAHSGQLII